MSFFHPKKKHFFLLLLLFFLPYKVYAEEKLVLLPHQFVKELERASDKIADKPEQKVWKEAAAEWEEVLDEAEAYIHNQNYNENTSRYYYKLVVDVSQQALNWRAIVERMLDEQKKLLDTLGPMPHPDQVKETDDIIEKRIVYMAQVRQSEANQKHVELTLKRAESMTTQLSSLRRGQLISQLKRRNSLPLSSATLAIAWPDFIEQLTVVGNAFIEFFSSARHLLIKSSTDYRFMFIIAVSLFGLLFLQRFLIANYGRTASQEVPSYLRRMIAAIIEVVAKGGLPFGIVYALYILIEHLGAKGEKAFLPFIEAAMQSALIFIVLGGLVRVVFSPERPEWRLVRFSARGSSIVGTLLTLLVIVFSLDFFLTRVFSEVRISIELQSLFDFSFLLLESIIFFALLPRRWWRFTSEENDADVLREPPLLWNFLRYLSAAALGVALVSSVFGYITLGNYLLGGVAETIAIFVLLYSARAIMHEAVSALVRVRFLRKTLELRIVTLQRIKFWFNTAIDPLLVLAGAFLIVRSWGVPEEDLLRWTGTAFTGFTVGSITISVVDIAAGVTLFIVFMLITRTLQRVLLNHVMPQVTNNKGMHHSVSAGVGYLGLIVSLMVGVTALGVDLSNIALIAGALSVGIGFGLQNIVSNFVSGIILLFEQPIKVNDWVVVDGQEGFVKRINFRATELETFNKASVIIPNADLLSQPVTNWTLKDSQGRVDVTVTVSHGTDTELVEKIMLDAANNHPRVLQHTELPVVVPPFVLFHRFGTNGLDFELRCFIEDILWVFIVASELRFAIDKAFREAGITVPYQHRVIHFANELDIKNGSPNEPESALYSAAG